MTYSLVDRQLQTTVGDDDIRVLSILAISKLTGVSRDRIRREMNLWESSRGAFGLPFMRIDGDARRCRKAMVLEWMKQMERKAAHRG